MAEGRSRPFSNRCVLLIQRRALQRLWQQERHPIVFRYAVEQAGRTELNLYHHCVHWLFRAHVAFPAEALFHERSQRACRCLRAARAFSGPLGTIAQRFA